MASTERQLLALAGATAVVLCAIRRWLARNTAASGADCQAPPLAPPLEPPEQDPPIDAADASSPPASQPEQHDAVVWISIDPRSGCLSVYPGNIAEFIEAGYQAGASSVNLGSDFFNADITFTEPHGMWQRTARGRRGVRRVVLPSDATECRQQVMEGPRSWKFAAEGTGVERAVALPEGALVDALAVGSALDRGESFSLTQHIELLNPSTAEESARALWQWCREAGPGVDATALSDDSWGNYGKAQSAAIEEAYRSARDSVKISLGVREFEVKLKGDGTGAQLDVQNRKKRMVRRKVLSTPEELEQIWAQSPLARTRSVDTCPICCEEFAETVVMPTVEMPCCQHTLHRVCVQHLADDERGCPMCRAYVDWAALGFLLRGRA